MHRLACVIIIVADALTPIRHHGINDHSVVAANSDIWTVLCNLHIALQALNRLGLKEPGGRQHVGFFVIGGVVLVCR